MRGACAASRRSKAEIAPPGSRLATDPEIACAFDLRSPAAATSTRKPQRGGGHGWPPFSDRGRRPSPKIPSPPARLERLVEEGAFFAYFLCTSKESRSPQAKALPRKTTTYRSRASRLPA